ncbi:hypothetical protein [Paenibacillus sp. 1001270B_150601_E10]|uniref:hypothetical protein n=1 Tax=Paenibacillus sp. 1001270B_150601_E10 TaxID=2787079 RepID=UPI00189D6A8A|nr:hypothetical protein [Paenibacillus sp. 1001270B_150601_E10]
MYLNAYVRGYADTITIYRIAVCGKSLLVGHLVNTLLSYPDVPFEFRGIYHPDTGKEAGSPKYRLSDRLLYPKELQMIKYVRSQLKQKRNVVIYATFTGKLNTLERIEMLLRERGIKTAILSSNIPGPKREEWIEERVQEGV